MCTRDMNSSGCSKRKHIEIPGVLIEAALGAIQGHSVIEVEPTLMKWRRIFACEAPRLYHGTRCCNTNSIIKHGLLPGKTIDPGLATSSSVQPERPPPAKDGGRRLPQRERRHRRRRRRHDNLTTLDGHKLNSEVVVVDAQVACSEGCHLFIRRSNTILCQEHVPMNALIRIRCAASNTMTWRCGATADVNQSSSRVSPRENPNAPPRHE